VFLMNTGDVLPSNNCPVIAIDLLYNCTAPHTHQILDNAQTLISFMDNLDMKNTGVVGKPVRAICLQKTKKAADRFQFHIQGGSK
jgi:hypothetical protein